MSFIKEIEVKNFLSLKNVKVTFKKFDVLIGPNASGKSNIIKLLLFLKEVIRNIVLMKQLKH